MVTPHVRYSDRVFIVGATGSGKSVLARALFESAAGVRLVVDPAGSSGTKLPGCATVIGPESPNLRGSALVREVYARLTAAAEGAATVRYVPYLPDRLPEYDAVYRWAFDRPPMFVWADEMGSIAPAHGTPPQVRRFLTQGRKRELGHLGCHTRPREVNANMIGQSQHLAVFRLDRPDDLRYIAESIGEDHRDLAARLRALPEHGFLWRDQRRGTTVECDPL